MTHNNLFLGENLPAAYIPFKHGCIGQKYCEHNPCTHPDCLSDVCKITGKNIPPLTLEQN